MSDVRTTTQNRGHQSPQSVGAVADDRHIWETLSALCLLFTRRCTGKWNAAEFERMLCTFLCVLRVTGAHLFKVAVEVYHAPAVSAACTCGCLPCSGPASHPHDASVFIEENRHYILGQNSRKHDMGNSERGFLGRFLVLSLFCLQRQTGFSAKWCKKKILLQMTGFLVGYR